MFPNTTPQAGPKGHGLREHVEAYPMKELVSWCYVRGEEDVSPRCLRLDPRGRPCCQQQRGRKSYPFLIGGSDRRGVRTELAALFVGSAIAGDETGGASGFLAGSGEKEPLTGKMATPVLREVLADICQRLNKPRIHRKKLVKPIKRTPAAPAMYILGVVDVEAITTAVGRMFENPRMRIFLSLG